jgi:hypothetical protein
LLACLRALENYLYLETEFQMNLKFKRSSFSPKVFQEKKMQVFPSKTTKYQLQAVTIHVDIFINIVIEHFKLKPYTVLTLQLAVLATSKAFTLAEK